MSAGSDTPSRYLHLWTPRLSTDRVRRERNGVTPERPLAVVGTAANALRLFAVDAAAAAAGLAPGLTLTRARQIAPELQTAPHDPGADRRLVERLVEVCRRFTPCVATEGSDALVLNITGAARLFGGEAALEAEACAAFGREGVEVRPGLADTPGLAWALCRYARSPRAPPGREERAAALAGLPVEALRLGPQDTADLKGLGFARVGAVMERPRALLAEALEGRLGVRLDEMLGAVPCALELRLERPRFMAERRLPEAAADEAQVLRWVRRLAEAVCLRLAEHGRGARRLTLTLFRVDGAVRRVTVRTRRAHADPADMTRLFESRLEGLNEGLEADFGFDHLRLEATGSERLVARAGDLLQDDPAEARFEAFAESLVARLGEGALEVLRPVTGTLKPEREVAFRPYCEPERRDRNAPAPPPPRWGDAPLRPLRLFEPPQPVEVLAGAPDNPPATLVWRRQRRRVVKAEGPERLSPEWGREPEAARTRDYFRVEDDTGRRYWVFREGLYGRDEPIRWFLHGLFA